MVADVARTLPANDQLAHVFYEERTDLRITLASSGLRDVVSTRTRGAVISGRHSVHLTDPSFLGPPWITPAGALQGAGELRHADQNWVADLEAAVIRGGTTASRGRRDPFWSVKLVSFHQEVWVGLPGRDVVSDPRAGCRMEIRAQIDNERGASAVEELVLAPGSAPRVTEAFARAFERAETRASISSPPKPGSTAAVFAPGVAGVIAHEMIGHALEGDVVARDQTWIRAAASSAAIAPVTVIDDPRRGRGAWLVDDEGVVSGETLLIERGRSVGMLLDRSSARAQGRVSTGHGRRSSYLDPVRPRMGCTFIAPGGDDPFDLLRGTREGVFIRRMTAGQTDPISGRASFVVVDADRIVDGRLAEPVDIFVLELDGHDSWNSIDRIAHDLAFDTCIGSCVRDGQPLAVSVGAPTIRIGVARVHSWAETEGL